MNQRHRESVSVLIVAVPETAGSALYGMLDVLSVADLTTAHTQRIRTAVVLRRDRVARAAAFYLRKRRAGQAGYRDRG